MSIGANNITVLDKQDIIKRLRDIEARAEGLRNECHNTIKMLEAESSATSTRQGYLAQLGAQAVIDRELRMAKKHQTQG